MCGIFSILKSEDKKVSIENFYKGIKRGPEYSEIVNINNNVTMGFHRLAINGYNNPKSNQPIFQNKCYLICNGEIYNWKELHDIIGVDNKTGSDCEIIIEMYKKYGIEYTLSKLDGVFAFVLYDTEKNRMYIARDPFGVRPLYVLKDTSQWRKFCTIFASEIKMFKIDKNNDYDLYQFEPGSYTEYNVDTFNKKHKKYYNIYTISTNITYDNEEIVLSSIRRTLTEAVRKRTQNTDREIACLLSGGLDSSLITALVKQEYKENILHTFSIGMKGSDDLKCAEIVSKHIGSIHHPIELEKKDFLDAIEEVIKTIESYDTTTVRASVGNWLVCKHLKKQSNAKVIFNGDGSDEVTGGYLYFKCAPNELDFDYECKRLLSDIYYFDVLRSDRSIASHGLEARTPFLDKAFVENYLSIPLKYRKNNIEKYILRKAFNNTGLLPENILWRTKEAFSDGVSHHTESWFVTIQKYAKEFYSKKGIDLSMSEAEKKYYKDIFDNFYPNCDKIIPYFWMPKFVKATDASARTLDIYNNDEK